MATQDKVMLMHQVEDVLKPRMFANLLEEAVTEIQDRLDDYDVQRIATSDTTGQEDLLDAFISAKRVEGRSELTLVRYRYSIERFLRTIGVRTKDVTTQHVRDYFTKEKERGIADSTIEGLREMFNSYFGWLEHEKLIRTNPVYNISTIKYQKKVRETISDPDMERLKMACESIRESALLSVLRSTGCRVGEISGMNRTDVNYSNGECVVLGKGNKERTVFFDGVALMIVKEYLATRNDENEALFVNPHGERLKPGGIRFILKRISKTAGVTNVHPHRFRRTLITNLLNRGMPMQEVAILAGHDKVDTTMQYFTANKEIIKTSYERYSR